MPLEILVDTKQKNGIRKSPLQTFEHMDSLSQFIARQPEMARPLSIVEGMKFVRQAYYDGDSSSYGLPNSFDVSFLASYLNTRTNAAGASGSNQFTRLVSSFIDSTKQYARISVNMADVGSKRLPVILDTLQKKQVNISTARSTRCISPVPALPFWKAAALSSTGSRKVSCMLFY